MTPRSLETYDCGARGPQLQQTEREMDPGDAGTAVVSGASSGIGSASLAPRHPESFPPRLAATLTWLLAPAEPAAVMSDHGQQARRQARKLSSAKSPQQRVTPA
jgi:hypothetical protein